MYIHALLIIIASYLYILCSGMLQKDYQVHLAKCKGGQEGPMGTRRTKEGSRRVHQHRKRRTWEFQQLEVTISSMFQSQASTFQHQDPSRHLRQTNLLDPKSTGPTGPPQLGHGKAPLMSCLQSAHRFAEAPVDRCAARDWHSLTMLGKKYPAAEKTQKNHHDTFYFPKTCSTYVCTVYTST